MFNIKGYTDSVRDRLISGDITTWDAGKELCRGGYFNFVPDEHTVLDYLGIKPPGYLWRDGYIGVLVSPEYDIMPLYMFPGGMSHESIETALKFGSNNREELQRRFNNEKGI